MFLVNLDASRIYAKLSNSQTIIFDVAAPLDEVRAPADAVKSTAIALVKVDSTFLPGTTIGATHWVAYAMTKGWYCIFGAFSGRHSFMTRSRQGDLTLEWRSYAFAASTAVPHISCRQ